MPLPLLSATVLPLPARTEFITVETSLTSVRCAEARYPPRLVIPEHVHRKASVTLVLGGSFVESQGRVAKAACGAGTAVFRHAGEPHANSTGPAGARNLEIELSAELAAASDFETLHQGIVNHSGLIRLARRMRTELGICDRARSWVVEGLALEIVGMGLRVKNEAADRECPPWLRRVRERLEDDFRRDVSVRSLAAAEGVHPVHLARAFRQKFGVSPGEMVRARRIDWAAEVLSAHPERSITQVALEAGFFDHSHFARAFKARTGLSPSAYRRLRPRSAKRSHA